MTRTGPERAPEAPLPTAAAAHGDLLAGTGSSSGSELARLAVILAAVVGIGFATGYGPTVLVVGLVIGCIVAHEAGHFAAARAGGVKVTEFFVFFGPRLWSTRRGGTVFGVKSLPFGGYCRIVGMNNLEQVDPADEPCTYRSASLARRLLIDVAGSATHVVIALLLLFAMFFWTGDKGAYLSKVPADSPVDTIVAFQSTSPAERAGFRLGDRIEEVDGRHFATWEALGAYIQSHPGDELAFEVERGGRLLALRATPVPADTVTSPAGSDLPRGKVGVIGIGVDATIHSGLGASLSHTFGAFANLAGSTFTGIAHVLSPGGLHRIAHMVSSRQAAERDTSDRLSSPIGVTRVLHQATVSGMPTVLWIVAAINVFVGMFNLLPIFPLDGARVVVALYEAVRGLRRRGYRADWAKLMPLFYAGLALVAFLGLSAMFMDLRDVAG